MKALILAAGEGTRMRPLTANVPKPLLAVAGKPFLQHIIETLKSNRVKDVYLLIGWKDRKIKEYFAKGEQFGVNITYLTQEERLGTAHAVGIAASHLDSDFLCLNGDIVVSDSYIKGLLEFRKTHKGSIMSLAPVDRPERFGVVELEEDRVKEIVEKPKFPKSNLINAGIYIFSRDVFPAIERTGLSTRGEYEITDTLKLMMSEAEVYGHVLDEPWVEIGRPWDLLNANMRLMEGLQPRNEGKVEKNVVLKGAVQIGEGTEVRSGSYLIGPIIIGKDCVIGPNCLIRPHTSVGNGCKVGNAVEVKNSVIMDASNVPHNSYVGDSIIGERCNLGAGTKVANLRLDERNISVILRGKLTDTGRRKLGVIMGDDVKTGINCSIEPGTIVGENSFLGPNSLIRGSIAASSRIH